jgi:hypothetical protein
MENQLPQRGCRRVYDRAYGINQQPICLAVHPLADHCVGKSAPKKAHLPSNYYRCANRCCEYRSGTSVSTITVLYRQPPKHLKLFNKANFLLLSLTSMDHNLLRNT